MDGIGGQLLDLLWQALPTTLIVFFLFFFLRWAFWRPLERVLAERDQATEGARRDAASAAAAAEEKLHEYEEALRRARADIYREQESNRQLALEERSHLLGGARQQAADLIRQAKLEIARDVEQAKKELETESGRLAEQITRSLLAPAGAPRPPRSGDKRA